MPLTRRAPLSSDTLTDDLRRLLLEGPWAIGQTLRDLPDHDELRRLWRVHGDALRRTLPKGRQAWFEDRDAFVRLVRGEPPA